MHKALKIKPTNHTMENNSRICKFLITKIKNLKTLVNTNCYKTINCLPFRKTKYESFKAYLYQPSNQRLHHLSRENKDYKSFTF